MSGFFSFRRFAALLAKEVLQILRDRSVLAMGFGLPVVLMLIFGYGVSMDLDRVPAALLLGEQTPEARLVARKITASRYFAAVPVATRQEAERLLSRRDVELVVDIRQGFARDVARGRGEVGLTLYGVDAQTATAVRAYVNGAVALAVREMAAGTSGGGESGPPAVTLVQRMWFNDANTSGWYLVPGILVLVLAIAGGFLASLVIAREHERGTWDSLMVTPVTAPEILLSKFLPYFVISLGGYVLCLVLGVRMFAIPLRGSLVMLAVTAIAYACWSVVLGLFLSAKLRSQFLANEVVIVANFLPTMMLSGFLFDLRSVPQWIAAVGYMLPPTYALQSFRICFLSGGSADVLARNLAVILTWSAVVAAATLVCLRRKKAREDAR